MRFFLLEVYCGFSVNTAEKQYFFLLFLVGFLLENILLDISC